MMSAMSEPSPRATPPSDPVPAAVRVLVADDQAIVRSGLRQILQLLGFAVVGEATNGEEAVALARHLRPDVCLLDIRMPVMDGLAATAAIAGKDVADPIPVVILTTFDLDEYVEGAIANGASGFLLKDAGPALIAEAIHAAVRGDALISPSVTVRFLRHFAGSSPGSVPRPPDVGLTERELELVVAVARGWTNAELSSELYISLSTVKTHLASIQSKLSARNRVEIAAWAWRNGLMRHED
jgi:DNA-binding NarL/FixJ family response regulator